MLQEIVKEGSRIDIGANVGTCRNGSADGW